ncbi:MAG: YajD family HNH nuclease [Gammaproteobacteria bacterium]|nr:YajD family HNH nuclease [Gammaproteobacteria bacterium]
MANKQSKSSNKIDTDKLDKIVAKARGEAEKRLDGYREQSLRLHTWICGRCGREFTRGNLHELTVHHKDHNHDNNPADGSNWENLCLYCHDNEHQRYVDKVRGFDGLTKEKTSTSATFNPFADLADKMKNGKS